MNAADTVSVVVDPGEELPALHLEVANLVAPHLLTDEGVSNAISALVSTLGAVIAQIDSRAVRRAVAKNVADGLWPHVVERRKSLAETDQGVALADSEPEGSA